MDGQISLKSDIWAFGCVMLEFCTGQQPYDGMSDDLTIVDHICTKKISPFDYAL